MCKRILVIDDFADIRKLFVRALEDTSYTVDVAESGERGVWLHDKNNYDLIFLDLNMPGMSGVEVLHKIRKTDDVVSICIVTAFYKEFIKELILANEQGIKFKVINKPINLKQIESIAKDYLEPSNVYN